MTDRFRWAVVGALAVVLGGCESPLAPPPVSGQVLSGTWSGCTSGGAGDQSTLIVFYPDASYLVTTKTFATTDRTCGGAETSARYEAWRYIIGAEVPANLGPSGTPVTAREMNIMNSLKTIYSIVYVDAQATPPVMYFGDLVLDPTLDGTAVTKRPDVLSTAALSGT